MSWEVHFVWITLSFSLIRLSNYICLQSSKTIYITQLRGKFRVTIVITLGLDTSLFPVLISCTSVENALSCKRMIWSWDCSIRSRSARSGSCSNRFWCIRNDFNPAALRVLGAANYAGLYISLLAVLLTWSNTCSLQFWNWTSLTHSLWNSWQVSSWAGCAVATEKQMKRIAVSQLSV